MTNTNNDGPGRTYRVLRVLAGDHDTPRLEQLPPVVAHGAEQAARRAAEHLDPGALEAGVTLVAIPERNWTQVIVQLKREQRLVTTS